MDKSIIYRHATNGISVSSDGKFIYKGKLKKVTFAKTVSGRRATARISLMINNKILYYQAAKLVAMAWKPNYHDGCCIVYKDGNCHNIASENLGITDDKTYRNYLMRNSNGVKAKNIEQRISKLDQIIKEASLTREYFQTLSMDNINVHVSANLIPILEDYCVNTLHLGVSTTKRMVPDVLARMYEVIMNGMCLFNYERYCKKLLLNYKKIGEYGVVGSVPKPVEIVINKLNFDCLCEKYNKKR